MKYFFMILMFWSFGTSALAQEGVYTTQDFLRRTSMVSVLANPQQYDGNRIKVFGFLHAESDGGLSLYLSKTDSDYLNYENAISAEFSKTVTFRRLCDVKPNTSTTDPKRYDGRYVSLQGTLNVREHGHDGAFAGVLEKVILLVEEPKFYDGRKGLLPTKICEQY